jgi:hypothetical protein
MKPSTKATIALPFTVVFLTLVLYLVVTHPGILLYPLLIVSFVAIIGSIWYALYTSFGGEI